MHQKTHDYMIGGSIEVSLRQHVSLGSVVTAAGAVRSVCWINIGSRGSNVLVLVDGQLILMNPNKVNVSVQCFCMTVSLTMLIIGKESTS
jgi:hypothetical protein